MTDIMMNAMIWTGLLGGLLMMTLIILGACFVKVLTIQEATYVALKYRGKFVYGGLEFHGRGFNQGGRISPENGPNEYGECWCIWRFGGWVFYLSPLVKPAQYLDQNDDDGFGEGIFVRLNDRTSEPFVAMAETSDASGSIPLSVSFVATMRVVNPYLWLFVAPKNANAQVVKRLNSALRAWVRSGGEDHAQAAKGNGRQLWVDLAGQGSLSVFEDIKNRWGLEIVPESIIPEDIGYTPEYQAALQAESMEKLLAKANAAKVGGPFNQLMEEWIIGQVKLSGKTAAEVLAEVHANGSYDKQARVFKDFILADEGKLDVSRFEMGSPDGAPLPSGLTYLALGGSGGAGFLMGGGRKKGGRKDRDQDDRGNNRRGNRREENDNRSSAGRGRRGAEDMTTQDLEAELASSTE